MSRPTHLAEVDVPQHLPILAYSPEQVAQVLGISRTAVYALLARGEIKSLRIGKRRRIPVSAVTEYLHREMEHQSA